MDAQFTTLGALIGLAISIVLIIRKIAPAYCLILGALIGGLIGGGGLVNTVNTMVSGAGSMMSSVLRILTSGILAGALIKTGSAQKIAETIVDKMGQKLALAAVACNEHGIDAFFPILRGVVTLQEAMDSANAHKNMADTVEQVFRLLAIR